MYKSAEPGPAGLPEGPFVDYVFSVIYSETVWN